MLVPAKRPTQTPKRRKIPTGALTQAIFNNDLEKLRGLIRACEVAGEYLKEKTPRQIAVEKGHKDLAELLGLWEARQLVVERT
jgi:hypothetical protein